MVFVCVCTHVQANVCVHVCVREGGMCVSVFVSVMLGLLQ